MQRVRANFKEGDRFNKLTIIEWHPESKKWKCKCDCGNITLGTTNSLTTDSKKSCGCLNKGLRPNKRLPNNQAIKNSLYISCKYAAIRRGYLFELTIDEFINLIEGHCKYCGIKPYCINNAKNVINYNRYKYNGVDRIDNTKGYTVKNSTSCCAICNNAKGTLTLKEFNNWIQRICKKTFND